MRDINATMARLERARPGNVILWSLLFIGGVVMITPIVFMVATSFKTGQEVYELSIIPSKPTLANYVFILQESKFMRWMLNSLWVATFSTASVLFFDSLVGYTLAKFDFRGRQIVFVAILSTLMIPTEMLIIPWYMMSRSFGWIDTYWGIAFPGLMTGFGTFLMRQFFMSLPDELIEAARIDGWSEFAIWWRIAIPLVIPALSALAIFHFLGNWTAFIWPLIVTNSPDTRPLTVGLSIFGAPENGVDISVISAATMMSVAPLLIAFLIFQRQFVQAFLRTGIK